ncbi:hypothetical protein [Dongshaea marina]|uniref:hypothetical protein n=1 Tax=Dongshaea marina TaxID=2047966 RepID=UPI000D3E6117|nr:hypothetical protein [Dongshaea marina]
MSYTSDEQDSRVLQRIRACVKKVVYSTKRHLIDEASKAVIRNQGMSPGDLGVKRTLIDSRKRMVRLFEAKLLQLEVTLNSSRMLFILRLEDAPDFCDRVLRVCPMADIFALDQIIGSGRQMEIAVEGFWPQVIDFYADQLWGAIQSYNKEQE